MLTLRAFNYLDVPVESVDGSDPGSAPDRPRQRHSGKVYLGPLNNATADDSSGILRPGAGFATTCLLATQKAEQPNGAFGSLLPTPRPRA